MREVPIKLAVFLKEHGIRPSGSPKMIVRRLVNGGHLPPQGKMSNKSARATLIHFAAKLDIPESAMRRHKIINPPSISRPKKVRNKFYSSWEWKKARYEAIKLYGAKCMCCGADEKIVVDHIMPVAKYPSLALDLNNLQILCNDCNMGKASDDTTDWRESSRLPNHEAEILNKLNWHGII